MATIMPEPDEDEVSYSGPLPSAEPVTSADKNAALHYKCNETLFHYNTMASGVLRPGPAPFPPACLPRQSHAAHSDS